MVIWTHNRNKQTSSTAGNAREQDNMDYKCVTGGFLGAEWKIDEAEKPLFCKSHDGSMHSNTKIFTSLMPIFIQTLYFFIFDLKVFLQIQIWLLDIFKK